MDKFPQKASPSHIGIEPSLVDCGNRASANGRSLASFSIKKSPSPSNAWMRRPVAIWEACCECWVVTLPVSFVKDGPNKLFYFYGLLCTCGTWRDSRG
jgi:hypothetical protein